MRAPALGWGVLLLLDVAAGAACAEGSGVARHSLPFEARLALEDPAGRPSLAFGSGQEIVLVLTLSNEADALSSLPLSTAQSYDFTVSGPDGRELWRWSEGRRFAQMLGELALAPGEERQFRAAWIPRDAEGAPLPAGRYRAVGWVGGRESGVRVEALEFRID